MSWVFQYWLWLLVYSLCS